MRKKLIVIITILSLVLSITPLSSVAATAVTETILAVESVEGLPGETVNINIDLHNNPGIASLKFNVEYDKYLTLTNVEFNSAFGSYVTTPEPYKNPQSISMISPLSDVTASGTFATLTFVIADNVPSDYDADIEITYDEDDVFNSDFDNVPVAVENGYIHIAGENETSFAVQAESVTGAPGETVQVKINLQNNPGIASLKFNVEYDKYLTLTNVEFNSTFGSYVTAPEPYKNPQSISMISPLSDVTESGTFATLTFVIDDNAPSDYDADIEITYDEDDVFNSDFDNVPVTVKNGCIHIAGESETSFTVQAESVTGVPGETVQVKINLKNNPGIASLKFNVEYDKYLTLTNVEFNSAFGSYVTASEPYKNPQSISMISPLSDVTASGTFATLTFVIADSAMSDYDADIEITYDEDDVFNSDFDNVPVTIENGIVHIENGYMIIPKENTSVVVDSSTKFVYGLDPMFTDINDYIKGVGCEIKMIPTALGNGTGSKINLMVNGEVKDTYIVLIFGDVNGDASCDGMDAVIVDCLAFGVLTKAETGTVICEAADCNHDDVVNSDDVGLLRDAGLYIDSVSQVKAN